MTDATNADKDQPVVSSQHTIVVDAREVNSAQRRRTHDDAFSSSMTFASFQQGELRNDCECDECDAILFRKQQGGNGDGSVPGQFVPDPILKAIQEHKRQKRVNGPLKRSQGRALNKREGQVAIWEWTLPPDSEPLVEYGTSHRLVWVKRLPRGREVKSIGKGIIGSGSEEQSRPSTNWRQDGIYLVPSNKGKAVGWANSDSSSQNGSDSGDKDDGSDAATPITLTIAKIPPPSLEESVGQQQEEVEKHWASQLQSICVELLKQHQPKDEASGDDSLSSILVDERNSSILKGLLS
mmetsp:Transcript_21549/g.44959  ORF Transcript_21549/g.44959 Transcript_21549/m.44959 type:complete len:295 (-) Transcript_21549:268-1152(-)